MPRNARFGTRIGALCASICAIAGTAAAQPTITSLGNGSPLGVSNPTAGSIYVSGSNGTAVRWTLTGSTLSQADLGGGGGGDISSDGSFLAGIFANTSPQLAGNTAAGVSPPFSTTPTLVSSPIAVTEFAARRWASGAWSSMGSLPITPALMVYGSGSSGGSSGTFLTPNSISLNGRFVVGQAYISSYSSSAGTAISANTFNWRPYVWDAQANGGTGGITVLPTPFRTSTNTWRRRTGTAYCVSSDGLVIAGAQEHNIATTPTADPDGARPVVWRWNAGTSSYDMTFLPSGVNGSGFPYTITYTAGTMHMNDAGTVIVSHAVDNAGNSFIAKWVWNGASWDAPINLFSSLSTPATWLPSSVTSCGLPPTIFVTGMSDDSSLVIGSARYSTCGSFMTGGWIWTSGDSIATDWYDHLVAENAPDITTTYGPIGDNGDMTRGLPRIGSPISISPNGNVVGCMVLGPQLIPGAPSTLVHFTGGPACVPPSVTLNPATTTNFSACTSSIILNAGASGTAPLSYQWYKDGSPLFDGTSASGSQITGATTFQCRVNPPLTPSDAGTYHCVITGTCGSPVSTTNAVVQLDAAFPVAANDTCSTALTVVQGTNVLGAGESPCGAYINDPVNGSSCAPGSTSKTDRWYRFTPSTTGTYRLETCGANFDTVLSVFDACGSSELACNNDYVTGPTSGCTASRSRITSIEMTSSTPYLIRVAAPSAAFLSGTSLMNLTITAAPSPAANDSCTNATAAVVGNNAYDLTEATNDWFASCNTAAARDVWFVFTPAANGRVRLSTCGTSLNTVLSVQNACMGAEQACNDNSGLTGCSNQAVINDLIVGENSPIFIRVAGNTTTAVGSGNLLITVLCDSVDFNNDTLFPDTTDIDDFLSVFGGGVCSTGTCNDIDFNNDGLFPDTLDIDSLLSVFSGGACL